MKIIYHHAESGNFGDDINKTLWQEIFPTIHEVWPNHQLIGAGTILSRDKENSATKIVLGAGTGYKKPPRLDETWKIYFTRGPLTARRLKINEQKSITDPSILSLFTHSYHKNEIYHKVSYIPHCDSLKLSDWAWICEQAKFNFINPTSSVEAVISDIASSQCILTESLHGAIISDALRIPWKFVAASKQILSFKWKDWCASMRVPYRPYRVSTLYEKKLRYTKLLKYKVLHKLAKISLCPDDFLQLPIKKTDMHDRYGVIEQLISISKQGEFSLSEANILEKRQQELVDAMRAFAKDFSLECKL